MNEGASRRKFLKRLTTVLAAGAGASVLTKSGAGAEAGPQAAPQSKSRSATVEGRVKQIIVEELGVEKEKVVPTARLVEDLGADSLDVVELVMALEEAFDFEIPEDDAEKFRTVEDIVRYVQAHSKPAKNPGDNKPSQKSPG